MISLYLSLLASVATPPPLVSTSAPPIVYTPVNYNAPLPPSDDIVPEVRAKASLPSLFSTSDYPAAALRAGEQGTTAFAVAIDATGRVTHCSIAKGSGSFSLDWATCSIIQRRARFTPARDGAGRAVGDRTEGRIRWVLPPRPLIPYADHRMALVFSTDPSGTVTECRVEASTERPNLERLCASTMRHAQQIAFAAGQASLLANRELVLEQGLLVGGSERARGIGRDSGETLGKNLILALEIDAAGVVTKCAGAEGDEEVRQVNAGCTDAKARKFLPSDRGPDGPIRHAVRYLVAYARPVG